VRRNLRGRSRAGRGRAHDAAHAAQISARLWLRWYPLAAESPFFATERASTLFAGLAAHSFFASDQPLSSAIGLVLGATAHAVGWPVPRGGAGAIPRALLAHLASLGGAVHTFRRIDGSALREISSENALTLCDIAPRQLLFLTGDRLKARYRRVLERFQPHSKSILLSPSRFPGARPHAGAPSACT